MCATNEGCTGLTSITIPNSVTSIGAQAFSDCSGLTSIAIPNSVSSIGDMAFYGCDNIKNKIIVNNLFVFLPRNYEGHYNIPDHITTIVGGAFQNCKKLSSVLIPNSVSSIGSLAFENCTSLTSVIIPNSVTSIGIVAFLNCTNLTSVTIPNSVTSLGLGAFANCTIDKLFYDVNGNSDLGLKKVNELYIGENVSVVYDNFKYQGLKKIYLGKKVSQIMANAFEGSNIEEFTITGNEPPYCYPYVFLRQNLSGATLYVPESKTEYYMTTEPWSEFGSIKALQTDDIISAEKRGVVVCAAGGGISISGLANDERVDFYDADGKTLGSATAVDGSVFFSAKAGSIVIAKIGKESIKIVVR